MSILLNWWILPTGRVASGRVCPAACTAAGLFFFLVIYIFFLSPSFVQSGEASRGRVCHQRSDSVEFILVDFKSVQ